MQYTPKKRILYICTGNVFRSPVAAGMTRQLLRDSQTKVESAGILEYRGPPLSHAITELAMRYGIDLSRHKPRQVSADLVDAADLILVFDKKQIAELAERFQQTRGITFTIKDYAGYPNSKDMEDLWDKPVKTYESFILELRGYLQRCVERLESEKSGV